MYVFQFSTSSLTTNNLLQAHGGMEVSLQAMRDPRRRLETTGEDETTSEGGGGANDKGGTLTTMETHGRPLATTGGLDRQWSATSEDRGPRTTTEGHQR